MIPCWPHEDSPCYPMSNERQSILHYITSSSKMSTILSAVHAELVCWVDATWGLGYLAPHPGIATALMVRVLRTNTYLHQALAHRPNAVLTNSEFLIGQAAAAVLDTRGWRAVPNALLAPGTPPSDAWRELLRGEGPVRIVARAEPHKGIAELIAACPSDLTRDVEIVLATAGLEYWPGMQRDIVATCRHLAERQPRVRLLPAAGLAGGAAVPRRSGVYDDRLYRTGDLLQHRAGSAQRRHPGDHFRPRPRPDPDR